MQTAKDVSLEAVVHAGARSQREQSPIDMRIFETDVVLFQTAFFPLVNH